MVATYQSARHLYVTSAGTSIALAFLLWPPLKPVARTGVRRLAAAAGLLAYFTLTLFKACEPWQAVGRVSHQMASGLKATLGVIPKGATVVLDIPTHNDDRVHGWLWSFPFILEEPFVPRNLYRDYQFIEQPWLLAAAFKWWEVKGPLIQSLVSDPSADRTLHVIYWDEGARALYTKKKIMLGAEIQTALEGVLARPLAEVKTLRAEEAQQAVVALAQ